jgi:hypothetical protein|tara:strand:+ start:464 stop:694 length:231 start_codon:yes stop_codon:yes gene_type:complete
MLVRVKAVNFYTDESWILKFKDSQNNEYIAPSANVYSALGLHTSVTKKHLDSLDVGATVRVSYEVVEGQNIVTSIA